MAQQKISQELNPACLQWVGTQIQTSQEVSLASTNGFCFLGKPVSQRSLGSSDNEHYELSTQDLLWLGRLVKFRVLQNLAGATEGCMQMQTQGNANSRRRKREFSGVWPVWANIMERRKRRQL